ncbi:ATP-binding cassette domain-containing protein [Halieaceae bacterium IMCC14734]|uniref:ATP-binding cassette domain-containing protein n=1 Tax=Candidatus Litorirhabdus singularis TaxID=2518993 RepID=A0ABT3TGH7_9GAMM|nr:ATP-binding cassette domain-containing protein [Candidatus Litorirhabdus singularis]MCX2981417.1 ATP-binding cassette domain-containing protein [Candidatus Litorirhabdus singularis]
MAEPTTVLQCIDLGRTYRDAGLEVEVLRGINFELPSAARLAIIGASGSGKSTLLNLLGGLDIPSSGAVTMLGQDMSGLSEAQRCKLRNRSLGFVYQFHHLLPEFTALENVAMPLLIGGESRQAANARASAMLARVGLDTRLQHRPAQLSGGERQRVAIARALVTEPACVLMDEPTGNLDPTSANQVLALIDELMVSSNTSFIIVTHDPLIAAHMDQIWELSAGVLQRKGSA